MKRSSMIKVICVVCTLIFILSACEIYGLGERIRKSEGYFAYGINDVNNELYDGYYAFRKKSNFEYIDKYGNKTNGKYSLEHGILTLNVNDESLKMVVKNEILFENYDENIINSIEKDDKFYELLKNNFNITPDAAFKKDNNYIIMHTTKNISYYEEYQTIDNNLSLIKSVQMNKNPNDVWDIYDKNEYDENEEKNIKAKFFYYNGNVDRTIMEILVINFYSLNNILD